MRVFVKILIGMAVAGLGYYLWHKKTGKSLTIPDLSITGRKARIRIRSTPRGRKRSVTRVTHNGRRLAVRAAVSRP